MNTLWVLYDEGCPFCRWQMRCLKRLDWLRALRPIPISEASRLALPEPLSREELLEALHCVTPAGRVYKGARAFRRMGLRLPLLVPLALLLYVPGMIAVAEFFYKPISRNRYLLSRFWNCKKACHWHAPKERLL